MNQQEFYKKATDFKFHCTITNENDFEKRIFMSSIQTEFRILLEEDNSAKAIQIQAAFDYEQAKVLVSLGLYPDIKLPTRKEGKDFRLYVYLHGQSFICRWFNLTQKKYPYLSPIEVIFYQNPGGFAYFRAIQAYELLEWKIR